MSNLKNPVLLGKIGAPHGVQGELRVSSFTDDPMALGDYGVLRSRDGREFTLKKARPAKNVLVVRFKEIQTRNDAENVRGVELFVERSALPQNAEGDEFYIDDLIGMETIDEDKQVTGKIHGVPNFGAGDLLEISPKTATDRFGTNTWFLAFTKENVPEIDFEKRLVRIVMPNQISERDE